MIKDLYRLSCIVLFSLLLSAIRSSYALVDNSLNFVYPNSNWNSAIKNDYSNALNQHISPWKTHTGSSKSSLVYDQQITSEASNTFIFKEKFNGVLTPNSRIVRYNADNTIEIIESGVKIPHTQPTSASKTSETAISQCINYLGRGNPASSQSNLMVLPFRGSFYLVYVVIAHFSVLSQYTCYVNAISESPTIVFSFTNSKNAVGQSLYNGAVNFNTTEISSVYFLEDSGGKQAVFDCQGTNCTETATRFNSSTNTWSNNVSVSVAWGVQQVYQYFLNAHGRNGMDGSGGPGVAVSAAGTGNVIPHYISVGTNVTEATFTPNGIYYGSGDGVNYGPAVALDIIAHEWAHGVLHFSIPGGLGMNNFDESGALEESFCDVIGAMVDNYVYGESENTWKIGEGYYAPGSGKALRYMNDPTLADNKNLTINDDPDHYSKKYNGSLDNGGIHVNSGIVNKVFYLFAKGGSHPNGGPTMTGVGITAAAQIWYKAYTSYMTATTDFAGARDATVSACAVLFGASSSACFQVQVAWGLCGVGSVPTPTPNQLIVNPGFERSQSPWTISGTGVSWFSNSALASSGSGYLLLGTINGASGSATQSSIIMPNNTGNATLTFQLKVDTAETANAIQDFLSVEIRNSNTNAFLGTIATYSNLNYTSSKYVSCGPFSLFSYKSSPIKLTFSVFTNYNNPTYFYIDQVNINTFLY